MIFCLFHCWVTLAKVTGTKGTPRFCFWCSSDSWIIQISIPIDECLPSPHPNQAGWRWTATNDPHGLFKSTVLKEWHSNLGCDLPPCCWLLHRAFLELIWGSDSAALTWQTCCNQWRKLTLTYKLVCRLYLLYNSVCWNVSLLSSFHSRGIKLKDFPY